MSNVITSDVLTENRARVDRATMQDSAWARDCQRIESRPGPTIDAPRTELLDERLDIIAVQVESLGELQGP